MKIVVLNECFLKDEHIARLKALGELKLFTDTSTERQTVERLEDADAAIADSYLSPLTEVVFRQLPKLHYITINSTGYEVVDIEAARRHAIQISNIHGYTTEAVAEHTFALLLALNRHIIQFNERMHSRPYEVDPSDATQMPLLGFNLTGKTLGVIGLGAIGQRVSEIARVFGMKVLAYNRSPKNINGIQEVTLSKLLRQSDVVSLHLPLNVDSENMIGEKELSLMQPHALLINTARGKIVDTEALAKALRDKRIGGAGIDTLAQWDNINPLLSFDNVILTPHSGWYAQESFDNMANLVVENIEKFAEGNPQNLI